MRQKPIIGVLQKSFSFISRDRHFLSYLLAARQNVYCNLAFITLFSAVSYFWICVDIKMLKIAQTFEFESIFWKLLLMANINVCLIFPYICSLQWELHSHRFLPSCTSCTVFKYILINIKIHLCCAMGFTLLLLGLKTVFEIF